MRILNETIDLLFPFRCQICGKIADSSGRLEGLDSEFRRMMKRDPEYRICGKCLTETVPNTKDKRWFICLSEPMEGDPYPSLPLFIAFPYEGAIRRSELEIKFGRNEDLAHMLGILLGKVMSEDSLTASVMIPVPLSSERMRERGFNQAASIAASAAYELGIPFASDVLVRTRNTGRQTECRNNGERSANVEGAFSLSEKWDVTGMTVILTDDVATTGFTLHEAASALFRGGASTVLCAALSGNRQSKNSESF